MIWWGLAAVAAPPEVSLEQALAAAAADHPEVEAARWSTRAAAARRTGRTLDLLPRIELGAGVQWWTEPLEVQLVEGDFTLPPLFEDFGDITEPIVLREQRTSQLVARAALPLTGQLPLAYARSAAGHQVDAARADERSTRARVGVDVVEAYTSALAADELVEVSDAVVANLRSALDRALAMEEAGMVQRADRLQLEVALSEAELEAGSARSRRDLARQRLALVMGAEAEAVTPRPLGDAPLPPPPALEAGLARLDGRADLQATDALVDAARAGRRAATGQLLPSVAVVAQVERNGGQGQLAAQDQAFVGLDASFDLWGLGGRNADVRAARAEQARAESLQRLQRDGAALELRALHGRMAERHARIAIADTQVDQATESLRLLRERFEVQLVGTTELLEAERVLAQARIRRSTARHEYLSALAEWQRQTGVPVDPLGAL